MDEFQEQPQEQEATVGMGKLFGIFAALVVVCALFFSLGYTLGKKSVANTLIPEPVATASAATTPKPSPSQSLPKNVPEPSAPQSPIAADPEGAPADPASPPAPEMVRSGSFVVQVAAVSRKEDAEALVGALRKKDYPVFIVSNVPGDRLFHVQVGPYGSIKDAETMKARLSDDGYNPIVKK
jgi:DedD protein